MSVTALVADATYTVGTAAPDAEGAWALDWLVPPGVTGQVKIEVIDSTGSIALDTTGVTVP